MLLQFANARRKIVNLGGNLNDLVSSVGPDYGYCFFFGYVSS